MGRGIERAKYSEEREISRGFPVPSRGALPEGSLAVYAWACGESFSFVAEDGPSFPFRNMRKLLTGYVINSTGDTGDMVIFSKPI